MTMREKDLMCDDLVQKLTTGISLNPAEKSHLAECEDCMARVVTALAESAARKGTHNEGSCDRPEARKALEHGRRVFEREFGIVFPKK